MDITMTTGYIHPEMIRTTSNPITEGTITTGRDYIQEIKWPNYGTTKATSRVIGHVIYD